MTCTFVNISFWLIFMVGIEFVREKKKKKERSGGRQGTLPTKSSKHLR